MSDRWGSNLTDDGVARTVAARFRAALARKQQPVPEQLSMDDRITEDDLQPAAGPRQSARVCDECGSSLNVEMFCSFCHDEVCPTCGCCACHCGGWS